EGGRRRAAVLLREPDGAGPRGRPRAHASARRDGRGGSQGRRKSREERGKALNGFQLTLPAAPALGPSLRCRLLRRWGLHYAAGCSGVGAFITLPAAPALGPSLRCRLLRRWGPSPNACRLELGASNVGSFRKGL